MCDRYHPTVEEFLEHVEELRAKTSWDESFRLARVRARSARWRAASSWTATASFPHVLLAPGHPGLAFPDELAGDPRAVHAYDPHDYADEVEVVGAGMAAATEWLNALAAGASVVSVRRREPERRPLNLPRELFTRRGLAAYHETPPDERVAFLRRHSAPSYPPGRDLGRAARARAPRRSLPSRLRGERRSADQSARPGSSAGSATTRCSRRLVAEHGLETAEDWIVLTPDSTVPALTDAERTLALAGAPAQWAYPAADTLMGAKYAARRFLRKVQAWRTR